jgi:branched-chain amino acid aminotransferase
VVANYANSILAKLDAIRAGCDEAILLNLDGYISEGPGENVFIVKGGELFTPPLEAGALAGITRDSVIRIAGDERIPVHERNLKPEVDGRKIGSGNRGPITEKIQTIYFMAVRGRVRKYRKWLDFV